MIYYFGALRAGCWYKTRVKFRTLIRLLMYMLSWWLGSDWISVWLPWTLR